jgi:glutamate synthase domain-containing protein 3
MKGYKEKEPVIVIGGKVGSFLGEYLAGGLIVVLGLGADSIPVGNFTGTGMHGGKIFIRTDLELDSLPAQVAAKTAGDDDLREIAPCLSEFAGYFGLDAERLMKDRYYVLRPNESNPYHMLYTEN